MRFVQKVLSPTQKKKRRILLCLPYTIIFFLN